MANTTNYAGSYERAVRAYKNVKSPNKGKPLCNDGYIRLFKIEDNFLVTWGKYHKAYHSGPDLLSSPEAHLFTISPDNTYTCASDAYGDAPYSKISHACDYFNQSVRGGWFNLYPNRSVTQSRPGHWHNWEHPIFKGFKTRGGLVLTPVVPELEAEMDDIKSALFKRNKLLKKQLKIYHAFGLFNDMNIIESFATNDWYLQSQIRANFKVSSIDIDNPESLQQLVLMAPSFCSSGGVGLHYDSNTRQHSYDHPKRLEEIVRQATLIELAQTRDKKYKSYYNNPTPTGT